MIRPHWFFLIASIVAVTVDAFTSPTPTSYSHLPTVTYLFPTDAIVDVVSSNAAYLADTDISTIASTTNPAITTPSSSSGALLVWDEIDFFFETQPYAAALAVTSFKASMADLLAQWKSSTAPTTPVTQASLSSSSTRSRRFDRQGESSVKSPSLTPPNDFDPKRNLAFLLYGGFYQGMFLQFLYTVVYPWIYGSSPYQIQYQIHTDILFFGPLLTLPLAYIIKSIIVDSGNEISCSSSNNKILLGLEKYQYAVLHQNLLLTYWLVWAPAQTVNFTMVPPHLRVFFVAAVSFVWVFMLSLISSEEISMDRVQAREQEGPQKTIDLHAWQWVGPK
mmetsp:Transcript_50940/g.122805  ORF Transcript_50940/g.122805 Transcript_50940/m.122805 type:complete len:334 (+) Transcript_50940:223-1224(+)